MTEEELDALTAPGVRFGEVVRAQLSLYATVVPVARPRRWRWCWLLNPRVWQMRRLVARSSFGDREGRAARRLGRRVRRRWERQCRHGDTGSE